MATKFTKANTKDFRTYIGWLDKTQRDSLKLDKANIRTHYDAFTKDGSLKFEPPKDIKPKDDWLSKLWQVSTSNVMKDSLEKSIETAGDTARDLWTKKWDIYKASWEEQKAVIAEWNKDARTKAADRETLAQDKLDTEKANIELRREDAQTLFDRQEKIANRQSQISWASIWSSWLQLSAADMAAFKEDIIAKYGENIMTAEDLKNKTNMSLDWLASKYMWEFLTTKKEIDMFVNSLDDEEMKPVLDALSKAAEWDAQAATDAASYWVAAQKTLIEWKTAWVMWMEVQEDKQRQYEAGDQRQKSDILSFAMWENKWVMDVYKWNPELFDTMSYADAVSLLEKVVKTREDGMSPAAIQYLTNKATVEASWETFTEDPWMERIIDNFNRDFNISDYTQEHKTEKRWDTWTTTTDTTDLTDKHMKSLDWAYDKFGKDKVLESITKIKDTKPKLYESVLKYINNK